MATSRLADPMDVAEPWNEQRTPERETTSSEDELLASQPDREDDEEAAAWLVDVGLGGIIPKIFDGSPVTDATLSTVAGEQGLTRDQLTTVRRRIETLRATVKSRKSGGRAVNQRRDCRDIFGNQSDSNEMNSAGSSGRSRSATPDSLDSQESLKESTENLLSPIVWPQNAAESTSGPSVAELAFDLPKVAPKSEQRRRRSWNMNVDVTSPALQTKNVIRTPNRSRFFQANSSDDHVAFVDDDNDVQIVKYHLVGTFVMPRRRSSDPLHTSKASGGLDTLPPIPSSPRIPSEGGFDSLSREQKTKLQQLALVEVTTLFDRCNLVLTRKKKIRRRIRERVSRPLSHGGSGDSATVFGVPLTKLVQRDRHFQIDAVTPVIFTLMVRELRTHHLKEEGLLRVSGNQQKVNQLHKMIESHWKSNGPIDHRGFAAVENALSDSSAHDVAGLLKMFLRQLPESLLTSEYIGSFAQIADIDDRDEQLTAVNCLLLLLPEANRQTLRELLKFLREVVDNQTANRMTSQAVATVIGPNLFPPRIVKPASSKAGMDSINEVMAYTNKCHHVTEFLLKNQDDLFTVPVSLQQQLSRAKLK